MSLRELGEQTPTKQRVVGHLAAIGVDQGYGFYHGRWEPGVVRFVTSFATTTHDVDELVHAVRRLTAAAVEESWSKRARTQRSASGRRSEVAYMGRVR